MYRFIQPILAIGLLMIISNSAFSQAEHNDLIVTNDNDSIKCRIVKFEPDKLNYRIEDKNHEKLIKYSKINTVVVNDTTKFQSTINIETPDSGYAHVYYYRPYQYLGSAVKVKVKSNKEKLIKLESESYYLHKIPLNQQTFYKVPTAITISVKPTKEGEIIFIRCTNAGNSPKLTVTNPSIAKYQITQMKGTSQKWE